MKQSQFEQTYRDEWQQYDRHVERLTSRDDRELTDALHQFPEDYTRLCQQYALAQQRHYTPNLVEQLQQRVRRGHDILYQQRTGWWWGLINFFAVSFPQGVRQLWPHMLLASLLFFGVGIVFGIVCYLDETMIYKVMPREAVLTMEMMYAPDNALIGRSEAYQSSSRVFMFGYYIYNNIGIGLRTFALGILASLGTIAALLFNGLSIGGVAGHLTQLGFIDTFWGFVSGHSAFELAAIVICGAAGLRLGQPLIAPGRHRRAQAFAQAGRESIPLVMGASVLLLLAAAIEAFWSPLSLPLTMKVAVGLTLWLLLIVYLLLAGRQYSAPAGSTRS